MCLSCFYHTAFALEELEDLQGKKRSFLQFCAIASAPHPEDIVLVARQKE